MTREEMFMAIGEIDDKLIMRSEMLIKKKKNHKIMWYGGMLASAACLLLMFHTMPGVTLPESNPPISTENSSDNHGGGNGPDHPNDFIPGPVEDENVFEEQAYGMDVTLEWVDFNAGPIMPLAFANENKEIVAERELVYDFTTVTQADKGYVPVTDSYVLNNISDTEQKVTFYYPYVSAGSELATHMPEVVINQHKEATNIINGSYMGTDSMEMPRLFASYVSTDEYSYMLNEIVPLEETLNNELLNRKVVVYEFSDFDAGTVQGEAVTYAASFKADKMDNVYFNNMMDMVNPDTGYATLYFMFDQARDEGQNPAIYFLDEVPSEYEEQGYVYPEFTEANKSEEVTVCMTKRETTVAEMLETMVAEKLDTVMSDNDNTKEEMKELFYLRAAQMFCDMYQWNTDEVITAEDDIFYANSISDIIHYIFEEESVYLLAETITIPAGGSVTVEFEYLKHGNHQTYESQEALRDNYGYDNMPNLGTNVEYKQMKTAIMENGNIRIKDQNYGFDLDAGIREVELELDAERYYMIVKVLK